MIFARLIHLLISAYRRFFSPLLHLLAGPGQGCRFLPTCSDYADQAVREFGPYKGSWVAFKRICRCHPFSRSGYDPVRAIHQRHNQVISSRKV